MSDRPDQVERGGRATSTSQSPSRPDPGPAQPVHPNGPERTSLTSPGTRIRPDPVPESPALRVVLVSRDKMLAGALRSLIDAPGGVRMLDWYSDELDSAIRHADVVIVDMPPTLHQRTFDVIDGRFLGRTVVLLQEGERAEAVPTGPPRAILYRPLQIGELWSALTGAKGGSVTGERAASGVEPGDGEAENRAGTPEAEAAAVPEAPPGAEVEPEPEPKPEPEVQAGPEAAAGDQRPVDAAAGVEVEAQGLPVAESGRLIGLSGQELDPVIGPGQVAPGMDEATFERLRGWKTGPGARQPAASRKGQAPGRRRSEPQSAAARRAREADAEARREQARQKKEARARNREAARAEAGRRRAARADARTAAREEARQARAARVEERKAARTEAQEKRAAETDARRQQTQQENAAKAQARETARGQARQEKAARTEERRTARAAKAEAREAARAKAARERAARAETEEATRREAQQVRAAEAEKRRAPKAAEAKEREAARAAEAERWQAARAAEAEKRKAAKAEAARRRAAEAEAHEQQKNQAKAAKPEAREEAARQRAVRAEAREVERAAKAEAREAERAAKAAARPPERAAKAEARRMRAAGAEMAGAAVADARVADARVADAGAAGTRTHLADRLALPALVVGLLAVLGVAAAGWVGNGWADTRAGEVAVVRAAGGSGGGLVVQGPRVGPIEPLHALGVGAWLRVTEAGGPLEAVIREARAPSRFLLAGVAGLTAVLFLLLIRVGPGSGAAAGPGPAPLQRPGRLWRLGGAALAGALVALDPLLVRGGRSATGTVLAVLLAVGTVALAWGVPARPALRWLPLVAAGGGLALLVSPLALAVVAVPVVAELIQGRYQEARKDMAALGLAIGLWLLLPAWVAGQDLGAGQAGWLLGRPSGRGPVAESVNGRTQILPQTAATVSPVGAGRNKSGP